MIFNNRITDITYNKILPKVVDTKNDGNVATARVLGVQIGRTWTGHTMNQVIQIDNDSTGGAFDGLDEFSTAQTNNTRSLSWYVKGYYQSVVAAGMEQDVNTGEAQAIRYLTSIMDRAKTSLLDGIGSLIYGVGSGKNFEGFGLIADDGSLTSSYGGLSRATYGENINAYVDAAATLTLEEIAAAVDNSSAASVELERPNIGYMPAAVWSIFESLHYAAVQAKYDSVGLSGYSTINGNTPIGRTVPADVLKGASGFDSLSFRKIPFVADNKAPSGSLFLINEHYLEFPVLRSPSKSVKQVSPSPEAQEGYYAEAKLPSSVQFRDMMESINQYGSAGFFLVMGNLIHRNPKRNARLTGIVG
jgi:hypothetical protein